MTTEEIKAADETKTVADPDVKTEAETEVQTEAQVSKAEEKALSHGWKPKDQWDGDPDEWRDAQSYLDRGEFLSHISAQNKQIKELLAAQRQMAEHNRKLAEAAYKEELVELRQAKKAALEADDAAAVVEIEEKIDEVKDKAAEAKAVQTREAVGGGVSLEPPPEFKQWVDRNGWYAQNSEMRAVADGIGTTFAKDNPGKTPVEVLAHVERKVKQMYGLGTNPNRERQSAVEGGSGNRKEVKSTSKDDDVQLSEAESRAMKTFVSQGLMTEAEYKKQIRAMSKG